MTLDITTIGQDFADYALWIAPWLETPADNEVSK
jgi:hypothetical protein